MDLLAVWLLVTIAAFIGVYAYYIRAILKARAYLRSPRWSAGRLIEKS
jgi:hypothetical protein